MKKIIYFLITITTALTILITTTQVPQQSQACLGNKCFDLVMATTPEQRARGLMFQESLDPDTGMLFIFEEESPHPFWMKNTLIPLDIIWIRDDKIVFINRNTQPCQTTCELITPTESADRVLEVNAGTSDELGLVIGDMVEFRI